MDPSQYNHLLRLTPYELHKKLINHYVLKNKDSLSLLKRDTSRDKRDIDVIRENHRFLWDDDAKQDTWEQRLAKKYYDKLFKEFCISDLTYYKENKVAMRWQTENELVTGKGQFVCGEKRCQNNTDLKTWEVNFGYIEHGEKKNALVKLRLCSDCSMKLNFKHKRKELKQKKLKRLEKRSKQSKETTEKQTHHKHKVKTEERKTEDESSEGDDTGQDSISNVWKDTNVNIEEPSREDEFEEYLEHLLF